MKICSFCLKEVESNNYAITQQTNEIICFNCCGELHKKLMDENGRITLILGVNNKSLYVQNKFKTLLYKVKNTKISNRNKARLDVWFVDYAGIEWHGVHYGDNNALVHCKRLRTSLN